MVSRSFGLKILLGAALGISSGILFLKLLPTLPLRPHHPLLRLTGMQKPVVMGFLPYWLVAKASPDSLKKLNSITYFGLELNTDGTLIKHSNLQETEPGWHTLHTGRFSEKMKTIPSYQVDTSLLVHLSNEASISALLENPTTHANNLINDAEPIMKKYKFSDLNLDIESFRTASPAAQLQMSAFLREVKKNLVARKLGTLTIELTVSSLVQDFLLDPSVVGTVSDHIVLMAYDFHYRDSLISGPVAPVGGAKEKWVYDVSTSIALLTHIMPPEKILLGIPLYGYAWETLLYQPESAVIPGTGKTTTVLQADELMKNCVSCSVARDEISGSPYIILPPNEDSSIQQVYFEDSASLQQKIDLAQKFKLGGIALWAIGYENPALLQSLDTYLKSLLQ